MRAERAGWPAVAVVARESWLTGLPMMLLMALTLVVALAGCNTVEGIGKDAGNAAHAVKHAID